MGIFFFFGMGVLLFVALVMGTAILIAGIKELTGIDLYDC